MFLTKLYILLYPMKNEQRLDFLIASKVSKPLKDALIKEMKRLDRSESYIIRKALEEYYLTKKAK